VLDRYDWALRFVVALVLCACGSESAQVCSFTCTEDSECPSGTRCGQYNRCVGDAACECAAGAALGCADPQTVLTCNADGSGFTSEGCDPYICNESAGRCNTCTPSSVGCSIDAMAIDTCADDGLIAATEPCSAGCVLDGMTPRCKHIIPEFLPDVCDVRATTVEKEYTGTLDTTDAATSCDRVLPQTGGPEICLVRARKLAIADLKVTGSRAIAFVADDLEVTGLLDVSADGSRSGPGVYFSNGAFDTTFGGGGAGFRQSGASGGGNEFGGGGGAGGPPRSSLGAAFSGGTGAADDGGITSADDPLSGGGGGGVLLVACRGTASVTGIIDAGGGGGQTGPGTTDGGAGGGSGGYVVIQGAKVTVTGSLYLNGGGGGAGCYNQLPCTHGADALGPTTSGEGGSGGRPGGRGGIGDQPPARGVGQGISNAGTTGGGGGSVGRVQVFTPVGTIPTLNPAMPVTFEENKTVFTE
jgi:hypothetical protein